MATKNTIKHGITLGGNVNIYHAIVNSRPTLCTNIIHNLKTETHNIMIDINDIKLMHVIYDVLDIIAKNSLAAFKAVFDNAIPSKRVKRKIFKEIKESYPLKTFNLIKNEFEGFDFGQNNDVVDVCKNTIPDLISPGNMDKEILRATFSILGLFLTSNQLITVHTKKDNKL
jgi:hypothetical protein